MRTLLLAAGLAVIFSCKNSRDPTLPEASLSKDSLLVKENSGEIQNATNPVDEIKKEYNNIQTKLKAKKLTSTSFNYNCNDEISGKVTYYSDEGEIRMIEHSYDENSHFGSTEQYFVKEGNLFFIFKEDTVWNFDGGTPEKPITKDDITESRIYIQNNKPVKCLEKQYSIRSNTSGKPSPDKISNKETQCHIDELIKTYQSLLKNKDKKKEIQCL
ncbi:hypothetical protein B0A69_12640 [Chryseobacterium shigense]|uniref:Lipoprotein n=1 Tax=Chryseobacterium shigense TaxID=297244 RepID=A0A1N7JW18_9FLAO|nr:hypothetical protein [Chryseobacterium shigense]PQA93005.1 hypothetical protein B0A69_12640 [Chryseobacterium shigense]SIS53517.1 hypothetical protein SAMN05421639_107196 [Chryseobacterium shigense]